MSTAEVVALAGTIVGAMASALGVVWKRGNDSERRIVEVYEKRVVEQDAVWQGRLEDKDKEVQWLRQQLAELKATFAAEAREDRLVLEKFRETMQRALEPRSGGRT